MSYCSNCGQKLDGTEKLCPFCGQLVEEPIVFEDKDKIIEDLTKRIKELESGSANAELYSLRREVAQLKDQLRFRNISTTEQAVAELKKKQSNQTFLICFCIMVILIFFSLGFPFWIFY